MLVILSGVSGSGKDTIKKELIKRLENVETLPSFTSRAMRDGEVAGEAYYFVTKDQFEEMIKKDEFYEYDIHHDNYYGTSIKLLNEKIKSGKIIVKDIDVNGTENLKKLLKDEVKIITIFLRVPKKELKRRLEQRGQEKTPGEIILRLNRLDYEESKISKYDYVLKNNDLEKTVQIIMTIIKYEYDLKNPEF